MAVRKQADSTDGDGPDKLTLDVKEEIQADIDKKIDVGEDPLLPEGSARDRKKKGGQPNPRAPKIEEALKLTAEEINLIKDLRARKARFTPSLIKREWNKRRNMEMTTSGNILPEEPPSDWIPTS